MATVTNTSSSRRHWNHLRNEETGTTLELDPDESAEVELPEGFDDPNLEVTGDQSEPEAFTQVSTAITASADSESE